MSFVRSLLLSRVIYPSVSVVRNRYNLNPLLLNRSISVAASRLLCNAKETSDDSNNIRDASKDRTQVIPVETSIRYLESSAYKTTYGNDPVWKHYRRNFKGQLAPRKTRKTCIRGGVISTGNPCPICRDEYLVLDEKNIKLLQQFISPYSGQVLDAFDTGLCRKRQLELLVAVERARDTGAITFDVPFRKYNYSDYGVDLK